MEYLNFSTLALFLFKNEASLRQNGYQLKYEDGNNFFRDTLLIYRVDSFKSMYFSITSRSWDRYKQFCLFANNSCKYHYFVSPNENTVQRLNKDQLYNPLNTPEPNEELVKYGQIVMNMIYELAVKIKNDKIACDYSELYMV